MTTKRNMISVGLFIVLTVSLLDPAAIRKYGLLDPCRSARSGRSTSQAAATGTTTSGPCSCRRPGSTPRNDAQRPGGEVADVPRVVAQAREHMTHEASRLPRLEVAASQDA